MSCKFPIGVATIYKLPMLEQISNFIIHLIQQAGYFGVFLVTVSEAALIPIPSEITLTFSGFLANKGVFILPLVILFATLGEVIGSVIAYFLGVILEETLIVKIISKFGKFILVTEHDYYKAKDYFTKYGDKIVFFGRLIPGVRTFISLPAGILEMKFKKFLLYSFLGSLVWISFLSTLGFYLGERWKDIDIYFKKFELIVFVLLVLGVLFYINHKLRIIRFKN